MWIVIMNEQILVKLKAEKKHLKERYNVIKLGVFGSYARGEENSSSDVDILVEFTEVPGMKDFFETEEYLEKMLHKKIDLVREDAIRPELRKQILSEVIYL
jgi:uncharacterized protein